MKNKCIGIILAFTLIFATGLPFTSTVYAEAMSDADFRMYADSEDAKLLGVLGIIEQSEFFASNEKVTRGELAKYLTELSGLSASMLNKESMFSDVPASSAYAPYINFAVTQKYMAGYANGTFAPDDTAEVIQAFMGIVNMLGYEVYAAKYGGYPLGYQVMAKQLKLSSDISDVNRPLMRSDLYTIMNGALYSNVLKQKTFTNDRVEYVEGDNLL